MRELFRGLRVSLYMDPIQAWLKEAHEYLKIADCVLDTSSAQLIDNLALQRLWALPIDLSDISRELTSAAIGLKKFVGYSEIIDRIEKLLSMEIATSSLDHPLHALQASHLPLAHLVQSNLLESFELNSKKLVGSNDVILSQFSLREELNTGKRERTIQSLMEQSFAQKTLEVRLYAWPNLYYPDNYYEPHIWLWHLSKAHVVMPVSYPRSLRPYLWRNTRADWAIAQNASLYGSILRESRLLVTKTEEIPAEEPLPVPRHPKEWAQDSPLNIRVKFTVGHRCFDKAASAAYVWNSEKGILTPLSNFTGPPSGPATIVFKLVKDLSVQLGTSRAQAEKEAHHEWQEAARKAYIAQDCRRLKLNDLKHIASGEKLRLRAPERNTSLYRILSAHGTEKFHKLFPTEAAALMWATAVHAKHSSDGRDATKELADLFLGGGMEDAIREGLVEVVEAEGFEVYELTREMENGNDASC